MSKTDTQRTKKYAAKRLSNGDKQYKRWLPPELFDQVDAYIKKLLAKQPPKQD